MLSLTPEIHAAISASTAAQTVASSAEGFGVYAQTGVGVIISPGQISKGGTYGEQAGMNGQVDPQMGLHAGKLANPLGGNRHESTTGKTPVVDSKGGIDSFNDGGAGGRGFAYQQKPSSPQNENNNEQPTVYDHELLSGEFTMLFEQLGIIVWSIFDLFVSPILHSLNAWAEECSKPYTTKNSDNEGPLTLGAHPFEITTYSQKPNNVFITSISLKRNNAFEASGLAK